MNAQPTLSIREATADDVPRVQDLYAETGLDDGTPMPAAAALDVFWRMQRYPSYRMWVAEQDGRVVGTYVLLVMDNIAHFGRPCAIVEQVAVSADLQGAGIGKQMMHHAMAEARASGCYKLMLSSNVKREPAHAFYDALGFERHGYSFHVTFAAEDDHD